MRTVPRFKSQINFQAVFVAGIMGNANAGGKKAPQLKAKEAEEFVATTNCKFANQETDLRG